MLPDDVPNAFRSVTNLGPPMRVAGPWRGILMLVAFVLIGLAGLGALWLPHLARTKPLPGWLWWYYLTVVLIGSALVVRVIIRQARVRAVLYENGFAYASGDEVHAWTWEEIGAVTLGLGVGRKIICRSIETTSGDEVPVGYVPADVCRTIRERTFPLRRERLAELLSRGDLVDFGVLSLSEAEGVRSGDRLYPWTAIRALTIQGELEISMRDDGFVHAGGGSCSLAMVPNADVLLSLVAGKGVAVSPDPSRL